MLTIYFPTAWENSQVWGWMKQRHELIPYTISQFCHDCGVTHVKTTEEIAVEMLELLVLSSLTPRQDHARN